LRREEKGESEGESGREMETEGYSHIHTQQQEEQTEIKKRGKNNFESKCASFTPSFRSSP